MTGKKLERVNVTVVDNNKELVSGFCGISWYPQPIYRHTISNTFMELGVFGNRGKAFIVCVHDIFC